MVPRRSRTLSWIRRSDTAMHSQLMLPKSPIVRMPFASACAESVSVTIANRWRNADVEIFEFCLMSAILLLKYANF